MPSDESLPAADDPPLEFEWDHEKSARNAIERGLPFERAREFEFESAILTTDGRRDYRETRINAVGFIADRLHVLTFTRRSDVIRVISLRKANRREVRSYAANFEAR